MEDLTIKEINGLAKLEKKEAYTCYWGLAKTTHNYFRVYADTLIKCGLTEKIVLNGCSNKNNALAFDSKEDLETFMARSKATNLGEWEIQRLFNN